MNNWTKIATALFRAGIRIIEVRLHSPEPLASIRVLAGICGIGIGSGVCRGMAPPLLFFKKASAVVYAIQQKRKHYEAV